MYVYGNTVVVTGDSTSELVFGGKLLKTPRKFSDAFVKLDKRWQLVAHAVTDIQRDEKLSPRQRPRGVIEWGEIFHW